jgi:hypothetical protein
MWIWNIPGAQFSAPFGIDIAFGKEIIVSVATAVQIHILVDDVAVIILNGVPIGTATDGWVTPAYPRIAATLQPGSNILQISATNLAPGGAGLLVSVIRNSDSAILAHSDATWTWNI